MDTFDRITTTDGIELTKTILGYRWEVKDDALNSRSAERLEGWALNRDEALARAREAIEAVPSGRGQEF